MGLRSFDLVLEPIYPQHDDDPWHRNKWIKI